MTEADWLAWADTIRAKAWNRATAPKPRRDVRTPSVPTTSPEVRHVGTPAR